MSHKHCHVIEIGREPAEFKFETVQSTLPTPEKLTWDVNDEIIQGLEQAHKNVSELINDSDLKILHFKEYGSDMIKLGTFLFSLLFVDLVSQSQSRRVCANVAAIDILSYPQTVDCCL